MLLEAKNVRKTFEMNRGVFLKKVRLPAVRGVNLEIERKETVGLVGESGCGKSTLGRCLMRLMNIDSGSIRFLGQETTSLSGNKLFPLRRKMQMIFQDPFSALNPRASVSSILEEPLEIHESHKTVEERRTIVLELIKRVGLTADVLERYPHEFSGGQRQRIGIARAIAINPELIVCDEPVSALDVSVQAQIINLLLSLQEVMNLSYLFISHDLRVIRHLCHRVLIMYLGEIVEEGSARDIYESPLHPYTQALLSAIPRIKGEANRIILKGEPPQALQIPSGCTFHPRCPIAEGRCKVEVPLLRDIGGGRKVSCHLVK